MFTPFSTPIGHRSGGPVRVNGHMLDQKCSASEQSVSTAGNPPTNMSCPKCHRAVATVQDINGIRVYETYRKVADTVARREKHRQAGL